MTPQEIFTKVKDHLLAQNEKSWVDYSCMYRGPRGTQCAVGCLISDDIYSEDMEDMTANQLVSAFNNVLPQYFEDNMNLLSHLQSAHDSWPVETWEARLRQIAEDFNLNY